MVQTNQMISYLDTTLVPRQSSSKTSANDETKSDFSKALDQEMSADKQPVDNEQPEETPKAEQEQTTEGPQKPEAENTQKEAADGEAAGEAVAVVPWMMQAPMVQQAVTENQMTTAQVQLADTGVQQQTAAAATVIDGEAVMNQTDGNSAVSVQDSLKSADPELGIVRQTAGETGIAKQETQTVQQVQPQQNANAENAEVQPLQMQNTQQTEQPLQNVQPETQNTAGAAEMTPQTGQSQTAQPVQTAQDAPKAAQGQTVNMSNPQEGVQNLAKLMSENLTQGKNEFEIWMEPANLGKIGVKVAYEGGRAMISIMCMSEKAMEIVSQNAKTLGVILQQNTGSDTIVVVEQPEHQDYLQREAEQQDRGGKQQDDRESNGSSKEQELENQSFLQQLRLGLM